MKSEPWYDMKIFSKKKLIENEIKSGLTKAEISRKYNCSITSVNRAIKYHGIDYNKLKLSAKYERKCAVIDK